MYTFVGYVGLLCLVSAGMMASGCAYAIQQHRPLAAPLAGGLTGLMVGLAVLLFMALALAAA